MTKNIIRPTALALALVFASACSKQDEQPEQAPQQTTTATKTYEGPSSDDIKNQFSGMLGDSVNTAPDSDRKRTTPPDQAVNDTPPTETTNRRVPTPGREFTVTFNDNTGQRTVDIDVDKLVLGEHNGKPVLGVTVAFISQFDLKDEIGMAKRTPAQRRIIENADNNMSVHKPSIRVLTDHLQDDHGVPHEAMVEAYERSLPYFPELSK